MPSPISLSEFRTFAEQFATDHLSDYADYLASRGKNPTRKEINDPLWGTIGLTGVEVALLDSPLLQRLRLIRQLGVVHWVYPGALHTRFEHSLGVLRQAQYLCEAINNLGTQHGLRDLITPSKIHLVRLAALIHDTGHAAFSHVSEHSIDTIEELRSIPSEFARIHKAESRSLSEIFAYFIATSPAMKKLITVLIDHDNSYISLNANRQQNVEDIIAKLSRSIIGRSIDDRLPLLHEIISGPFDADKLDYFVRDAKSAGTPSLLDISRLTQKIAIRQFESEKLPGTTGKDINVTGQQHVLVGIKWSGISILDELHLSRVLLYSKIYRHPKVIAIEQMVRAALLLLLKASSARDILNLIYKNNDDAMLAMHISALASALNVDLERASDDQVQCLTKAQEIFEHIRMRRLFTKTFQLQRTYPGDPIQGQDNQRTGLIEFREIVDQPEDREAFRQRLIAEVRKVIASAGMPVRSAIDLEGSIMIQPIGKTPGGTQIGRAWLLPVSADPIEFRNYLVNRTGWADGYLSDQPAGYVFSDQDIADATFVALERLLRVEHDIRLSASALEASKRDAQSIATLKRKLSDAGYFEDAPFDIRPSPERLGHADIARSIELFTPKFEAYQAPILAADAVRPIARDTIRLWLHQFSSDDDIECASKIIDSVRMIERRDTVSALRSFLIQNPAFRDGIVVPFGSARDSSAIQTYFAGDLAGSEVSQCVSLEEASHTHNGKPLIFIDDFVGSGGQSRDILAAGFGRSDLRADLGETRNLFTHDIKHLLESAKIGFVFTAGWDDGLEEIKRTTTALGLSATIYRLIDEDQIPFVDKVLSTMPEQQVEAFISKCRDIGFGLLESGSRTKEGESPEDRKRRLSGRVLGYGNRGMLLASPFNVPTQTFTPLWANGMYKSAVWTPLLPRRPKS